GPWPAWTRPGSRRSRCGDGTAFAAGGGPSPLLLPADPGPVDRDDGLADAVALAEVVDGLPAGGPLVVVDDHPAARGEAAIEVLEGVHRRFVQVSIDADDGPGQIAESRQRVAEPALDEPDPVVEQAVAG